MTESAQFYFSMLRVSIIQILRSIGFDRCSNKVILILTDLYIRQLSRIVNECQQLALDSGRFDIEIPDISQAMVNLQIFKPGKILDPFDNSPENFLGCRNFLRWLKSEEFKRLQKLAKPTKEMVQNLEKSNNEETNLLKSPREMDWLKYSLLKDSRIEYEEKIQWSLLREMSGRILEKENEFEEADLFQDCKVIGPTPQHLIEVLPCRKIDDGVWNN